MLNLFSKNFCETSIDWISFMRQWYMFFPVNIWILCCIEEEIDLCFIDIDMICPVLFLKFFEEGTSLSLV